MPCRIGITTDPDRRKSEWEGKYPTLTNWELLKGPLATKQEAQVSETTLSQDLGCESAPGGDDPFVKWYVYKFDY